MTPRPTPFDSIKDVTKDEKAAHRELDEKGYLLSFIDGKPSRHTGVAAYRIIQRNTGNPPTDTPEALSFAEVENLAATLPVVKSSK